MNYYGNMVIIGIAVFALVATGCSNKEKPASAGTDEGIAAGDSWLAVVDAEQYDESWERACAFFRGVVPKEQWVTQVIEQQR
jgi:hypothetical protein